MRIALVTAFALALAGPAGAATGLFDLSARKAALQGLDYDGVRQSCLAIAADPAWLDLEPVAALTPTEGYGSDQRAEAFGWAVMVLGGRALAGDAESTAALKALLLRWADASALRATPPSHDGYFALKRALLPTVVNYAIIRDGLSPTERTKIDAWLDPLVRAVDRRFDGDVDDNNHRILADSVQSVWGSVIGDAKLYAKGPERFRATLTAARDDGGLPLEIRRGARALWYQRLALSGLTVIAETAATHGDDLYAAKVEGRGYDRLLGYFVSALRAPILVQASAAANYIPGPQADYLNQDFSFLKRRPHGRHYMAFSEAIAPRETAEFAHQRLAALIVAGPAGERPMIDDFAGGNATCFWGRP
ncbi:MAG TPA: alginate lyase family protein [Ancylobacter sp.]